MPDPSRAVLVTGCSSGIGRATAERLVTTGWTVYATARKPEALAHLEAAGCRTLALDVTDEASMAAAVRTVEEAEGVGVLVNNAGYSQSGAIESVPIERVRAQFETNVFGLVRLTQLVLPRMREQRWGKVVNLSSMGGRFTFPGGGFYHATKYAVEAISDALRFEVRGFGIDVVIVEPGLIRTSFGESAVTGMTGQVTADGPYSDFNVRVAQATAGVYESGALSRFGGPPESVAKVIEKAITARRPRPRYLVTPSARVLIAQRKLLRDRGWDAVMRTQFPQPGAK
jgi:NAD(P)-dependent dehydrogenase (short-subunit alcohol dehydrogenase family)